MPTIAVGANQISAPFRVDGGSIITVTPLTATVTYTTESESSVVNNGATFEPLPLNGSGSMLVTDGMWVKVAAVTATTISIDSSPSAESRKPWVGDYGPLYANVTIPVLVSRSLTNADDGKTLECAAGGLTLTVPAGLQSNFGCAVIPSGTTSIATSGGTQLNGSTSTLTRAAASNAAFALISRASSANNYVVTGT